MSTFARAGDRAVKSRPDCDHGCGRQTGHGGQRLRPSRPQKPYTSPYVHVYYDTQFNSTFFEEKSTNSTQLQLTQLSFIFEIKYNIWPTIIFESST